MTTILSLAAASVLAARTVAEAGGTMSRGDLLDGLDVAGVTDPIRADAAIGRALQNGRLRAVGGAGGADDGPLLAIPTSLSRAA